MAYPSYHIQGDKYSRETFPTAANIRQGGGQYISLDLSQRGG